MIDGNNPQSLYLYRISGGWWLRDAMNQVFSVVNNELTTVSDGLTTFYGSSQINPAPIPLSVAKGLGRVIRLDMLRGYHRVEEELNAVTDYLNGKNFLLDGRKIESIKLSPSLTLMFDDTFINKYNQMVNVIEKRLVLINQITDLYGLQ